MKIFLANKIRSRKMKWLYTISYTILPVSTASKTVVLHYQMFRTYYEGLFTKREVKLLPDAFSRQTLMRGRCTTTFGVTGVLETVSEFPAES